MAETNTVARSEKLDIDLREMGCRYIGKYAALDGSGRAVYQYLTPNGKLLFVYDLGDEKGWEILTPITEDNSIDATLAAVAAYSDRATA